MCTWSASNVTGRKRAPETLDYHRHATPRNPEQKSVNLVHETALNVTLKPKAKHGLNVQNSNDQSKNVQAIFLEASRSHAGFSASANTLVGEDFEALLAVRPWWLGVAHTHSNSRVLRTDTHLAGLVTISLVRRTGWLPVSGWSEYIDLRTLYSTRKKRWFSPRNVDPRLRVSGKRVRRLGQELRGVAVEHDCLAGRSVVQVVAVSQEKASGGVRNASRACGAEAVRGIGKEDSSRFRNLFVQQVRSKVLTSSGASPTTAFTKKFDPDPLGTRAHISLLSRDSCSRLATFPKCVECTPPPTTLPWRSLGEVRGRPHRWQGFY